jgi:hypothetical protein
MNSQSEITQIKETLLRRSGALERNKQELQKIQEEIKLAEAAVSDLTEAHTIQGLPGRKFNCDHGIAIHTI